MLSGDGTQVLRTVPVGDYPEVTALVPRHGRIYVGHSNTRYVYVVRDTTLGVAEPHTERLGFRGSLTITPNPFARRASVVWNLPVRRDAVGRMYAQDGRLVRQVRIPAGEARWVWDGRDDSGALLPPGIYVIEAGPGFRAKVVKLK